MSYGKGIRCLHCGYEEELEFTGNTAFGTYFLYWDEKTGKYRNVRSDLFALVEKNRYYGREMAEISYYELEIYLERFRCPKCKKIGFELNGSMWID